MNSLQDLLPVRREVTLSDGQVIEVAPLTIGRLADALPHLAPILAAANGEMDSWLDVLVAHRHNLIRAVAVALDRPPDWAGALLPDDLFALANAVLGVNADFFTRAVLPRMASGQPLTGTAGPSSCNG